jgi:hypothetical protein
MQVPQQPLNVTGRVTGLVTDEEAVGIVRRVEAQVGGKISPAYIHLRRVTMMVYAPAGNYLSIAAVPDGMKVRVANLVDVNTRYRDPALPCNFIPWIITHVAADRTG